MDHRYDARFANDKLPGIGGQFGAAEIVCHQELELTPGHKIGCQSPYGPPGQCYLCNPEADQRNSYPPPGQAVPEPYPLEHQHDRLGRGHRSSYGIDTPMPEGDAHHERAHEQATYQPTTPVGQWPQSQAELPPNALSGFGQAYVNTTQHPPFPFHTPTPLTPASERSYASAAQQPPTLRHAYPVPPSPLRRIRPEPQPGQASYARPGGHYLVVRASPELNESWYCDFLQQCNECGTPPEHMQYVIVAEQQRHRDREVEMMTPTSSPSRCPYPGYRRRMNEDPTSPGTWVRGTGSRLEDIIASHEAPRIPPSTPGQSSIASVLTPSTRSSVQRSPRTRVQMQASDDPFLCEPCDKKYEDLATLNKHIKRCHGDPALRKHGCDYEGCTKRFNHPRELTRHVASKHEKETSPKEFCTFPACKMHFKGFTRRDHFRRHMKTVHGSGSVSESTSKSTPSKKRPRSSGSDH